MRVSIFHPEIQVKALQLINSYKRKPQDSYILISSLNRVDFFLPICHDFLRSIESKSLKFIHIIQYDDSSLIDLLTLP